MLVQSRVMSSNISFGHSYCMGVLPALDASGRSSLHAKMRDIPVRFGKVCMRMNACHVEYHPAIRRLRELSSLPIVRQTRTENVFHADRIWNFATPRTFFH